MPSGGIRPYLSWSTEEMERHLWAFEKDESEIELALAELAHRKTQAAKDLANKLGRLIKEIRASAAAENIQSLKPETRKYMTGTLERLREKLIDISKRNPLIAFKHSERGATFVRVVDELPDQLFNSLQLV